jgi:hypothetical protein
MEMGCGVVGRVIFLTVLTVMLAGVEPSGATPFLFSANPNDVTVTQIDLATGQSRVVMDANDGLTRPGELTTDSFGNLYVANVFSPDILRLSQNGHVSVFVSGQGILSNPHGLAFHSRGDLFIADGTSIYRFGDNNSTLTLFGDVTSANPSFNILEDIEFDHDGNLYAASGQNIEGAGAIVKLDPQGNASVLTSGLANPRDLAVDGLGHLYVANRVGEVVNRLDLSTGSIQLFADLSGLPGDPRGVKTDLDNNVYVLNSNGAIRKWNSNGVGGNVAFQSGSTFSEALAFSLIPIPTALMVSLDIKPGGDPNCININGNGVIPVAILGSDDFDVTQIDIETLDFAGLAVRVRGNDNPQCSIEDVSGDFTSPEGTPDGYLDLVCQFVDDPGTWVPNDDSTATLTGNLLDGTPFEGTDSICIVP